MTISDSYGNAFIYDYVLYNIENETEDNGTFENINNFSFILDNNAFGNNEITIKLNLGNEEYNIDESNIEIIGKNGR